MWFRETVIQMRPLECWGGGQNTLGCVSWLRTLCPPPTLKRHYSVLNNRDEMNILKRKLTGGRWRSAGEASPVGPWAWSTVERGSRGCCKEELTLASNLNSWVRGSSVPLNGEPWASRGVWGWEWSACDAHRPEKWRAGEAHHEAWRSDPCVHSTSFNFL